jgi:phosphopantothenoylcysteine synthetase/decarboxylase
MAEIKHTVVLGITGSIAAYKGADLCSKLTQAGFDVNVIMTASAQELVRPRTFLTLSRNPVMTDLWSVPDWRPGHIELSERASILVIAPATANIIGKLACGIADDALSTFALSHQGTLLIAPGMNPRMWANPAVQENVEKLKRRGAVFAGPASGRVACGADGDGRMAEVDVIMQQVMKMLN